jgi:ABC-type antimicrobial peptide transport system permease subunit
LGKRIREGAADPWREIVGVVGDVYDNGPSQKPPSFAYWPALMDAFYGPRGWVSRGGVFIIRSSRAATESFLNETRQAIWSVNSNLPVFLVRTLKDIYDQSMARTSFTLVMLAIAGAMALVLGIIGIYGVIAYAVSQRTREIGIRMALGAGQAQVFRGVLGATIRLIGIGLACGALGSLLTNLLVANQVWTVSSFDPLILLAGIAAIVILGLAACYFPALRATRIQPLTALRHE